MGAKGDLGVELDLDRVPCREAGMTAYEMMLSESQERMLMVLRPEKAAAAEAIFNKWGLDFAVIGKTTDTKRFVVKLDGEVKADLPIKQLGDEAPLYDRPWTPTQRAPIFDAASLAPPLSTHEALLRLLASPDLCSKRWVTEQYDTLILGNTIEGPGGDAAVVRLGDGPKGLALTTDANERYCEADPVEGGRQAVAEAWRNLIAVGARPLALTDCLNFGNPEKPEAMGEFVGCLTGVGEAARALDFPVVSGNVSLYNETSGVGIPPTPTIGGVGLVDDVAKAASLMFKREGEAVLLIGGAPGWLGRSAWLATILKREEGAPPPVDLAAERRNGEFVFSLIRAGRLSAAHDVADGGLAVALAEMAIAGGVGAAIEKSAVEGPAHAFFFGEDQGRYVVTARAEESEALIAAARRAGVPARRLGTTGGRSLDLPDEPPLAIETLSAAFESWLPAFMDGRAGGRA
jgi:phosphoribosylformylglycinamidine synthase